MTIMIGQNDLDAERLSLADAEAIGRFARAHGVARLSLWSLNRDAQCGGAGNLARFLAHVERIMVQDPYREHLQGWRRSWRFADAGETEELLRDAGFGDVRVWLEPAPVTPEDPVEFLTVVPLRPHLERLPDELRGAFVADVLVAPPEPLLDYVRLNIEARRTR